MKTAIAAPPNQLFSERLLLATNPAITNRNICREQQQLTACDLLCGIELCVVCGDKASGNKYIL